MNKMYKTGADKEIHLPLKALLPGK